MLIMVLSCRWLIFDCFVSVCKISWLFIYCLCDIQWHTNQQRLQYSAYPTHTHANAAMEWYDGNDTKATRWCLSKYNETHCNGAMQCTRLPQVDRSWMVWRKYPIVFLSIHFFYFIWVVFWHCSIIKVCWMSTMEYGFWFSFYYDNMSSFVLPFYTHQKLIYLSILTIYGHRTTF